jgi:hypothetical protein
MQNKPIFIANSLTKQYNDMYNWMREYLYIRPAVVQIDIKIKNLFVL